MLEDVQKKVKEIIDGSFTVEEVSSVPDISDSRLTFGNKGLLFEATVLFIDINGSTDLLNNHQKGTVAKLHMAFFHIIVTVAKSLGGDVRSFNGDSMLVFFQGTSKRTLSNAVKAAMQMKYLLAIDENIKSQFSKYSTFDFGIGIDDGKILATKIGLGRDSNTQDLVWLGNSVNKSVRISEKVGGPSHIGISSYVYSNLTDEVKYHVKDKGTYFEQKIDMWNICSFTYNGEAQYYYCTSYYWTVP
jgi:Adenylate cyclase, family 3 (some proteins contain HAMP domain)